MNPEIFPQPDSKMSQNLAQPLDQLDTPVAVDSKIHEKGVEIIESVSHDPLKESKAVTTSLEQLEECKWMIGGKIHFEERDADDYIGILTLNRTVRETIKKVFLVTSDTCSPNAKILLKRENNHIVLTHYEEKTRPGIGEEMHATLLYTKRRVANGHETLRDVYEYLREVDSRLSKDQVPTVEQVFSAYQLIIKPDWKFTIDSVEYIKDGAVNVIVAKLLWNGRHEIVNQEGHPISGSFLHVTLVNIDASLATEEEKIQLLVKDLQNQLCGKFMKIGIRGEQIDLEFGQSGSKERVRPHL